jgi:hypothetical protein
LDGKIQSEQKGKDGIELPFHKNIAETQQSDLLKPLLNSACKGLGGNPAKKNMDIWTRKIPSKANPRKASTTWIRSEGSVRAEEKGKDDFPWV